MSEFVSIDVETTALLAALARFPDDVMFYAKPAAKVTAEAMANEMRARIKRRTGKTGDAITVEELRDGSGYLVYVGHGRQHVAFYLERGTKFMSRREFFFPAARLEEGPHMRRTRDAIQDAINSQGLGEGW